MFAARHHRFSSRSAALPPPPRKRGSVMTFETEAVMRSSCFIGLVVVLAGITAGTAPATSTTRTAMPGKNGRIVFVDGIDERQPRSRQRGRHRHRVRLTIRPGRRAGVLPERQADRVLEPAAAATATSTRWRPTASNLRQITFSQCRRPRPDLVSRRRATRVRDHPERRPDGHLQRRSRRDRIGEAGRNARERARSRLVAERGRGSPTRSSTAASGRSGS